ncbi:AP-5 complex subunit zeta-1-like isoform X2 [Lycorma delicatula]
MNFRKVLAHYRKQPNHYVQHLWENIHRSGIKSDCLRDILMFYLQHKIFPPVLQKSFDAVVMKLSEKGTTKKMRNVLVQIIDEVSYCLNPANIIDGFHLTASGVVNVDLLNCLLHNMSLPPVVNDSIFNRLISLLNESNINVATVDDRCKAFTFLITFCPERFNGQLSLLMAEWLQFSHSVSTTTQLFSRSDVTEIDGTPLVSLTTSLSLSSNMTVGHIMSILTFSQLRLWLSSFSVDNSVAIYKELMLAALAHCSVLIDQCLKKPNSQDDVPLITAVLCEVLDLLYLITEIDQELLDECISIVRQLETKKDTSLRIKIWRFYLSFDQSSADEYSHKMMKECISRCFTVGIDCFEFINLLVDDVDILQPLLVKYHPNLLKMFATHPQALLEEFIKVASYLVKSYDNDDIVEVFHRMIDLPVLSAVICIHQVPVLIKAGYNDPILTKIFNLQVSNGNIVFEHFIKTTSITQHTSQIIHLYPEFYSQIDKLNMQGLVLTCSQAAPLVLNSFLSSAIVTESTATALLPFMLSRLALIFQVPGYKEQLHSLIGDQLNHLFSIHPVLVSHESVIRFISNVKNMELCPAVYFHLIWALGEYTNK